METKQAASSSTSSLPSLTNLKDKIIDGIKKHSDYKKWLEDFSTPLNKLNAIHMTLATLLSQWVHWSSDYTGLQPFVLQLMDWTNKNLAELNPGECPPLTLSKFTSGILSNIERLMVKSTNWPALSGPLSTPPPALDVFLRHCHRLLEKAPTEQVYLFSPKTLLFFLQNLFKSSSPTKFANTAGAIGLVVGCNLCKEQAFDIQWLEEQIGSFQQKLSPEAAAQYLNCFSALKKESIKFPLNNKPLATATINRLLADLAKPHASYKTLVSGLRSLETLLSKWAFDPYSLDMKTLEKLSNNLLAHFLSDEDIKGIPSSSISLAFVNDSQLLRTIFQRINNRLSTPKAVPISVMDNLLKIVSKNPAAGCDALSAICEMPHIGRSSTVDKQSLQPAVSALAIKLNGLAGSMSVPKIAQTLYDLSLLGHTKAHEVDQLIKAFEKHLKDYQASLCTNPVWQKRAHQGARYLARSHYISSKIPKYLAAYLEARKPEPNERQKLLAQLLPDQPWFDGYTCALERRISIYDVDIAVIHKETGNIYVFELDDLKDHTEGSEEERQERLRWKDEERDDWLCSDFRDEKTGKPVKKVRRMKLWPPHPSKPDDLLNIIKNTLAAQPTAHPDEIKTRVDLPALPEKKAKDRLDTPLVPPTVVADNTIEDVKVKKTPQPPISLYKKSLEGLLHAVKDSDAVGVTTLMNQHPVVKLTDEQKSDLLVAALEQPASGGRTAILKLLCERFTTEIISKKNSSGLSPIVCATKRQDGEVIRIITNKITKPLKTPNTEWQQAAQIADEKIAKVLKSKGVTAPALPSHPTATTLLSPIKPKEEEGIDGQLAAEQGDPFAQFILSLLYKDTDKDIFLFWIKKSAASHLPAQNYLAHCYIEGRIVPQDYKEATKLFQLAAAQGSAEAQFNLGICYEEGYGVPQDYKEAARLFKAGAAKGLPEAQVRLGNCFYLGQGRPQDYKKAVSLFRLAAAQESAEAQSFLGRCFQEGKGVPKQDHKKAVEFFQLAAAQKLPGGQLNLGHCYLQGIGGLQEDPKEARKFYQLAADQKLPLAQFHLAKCYEQGIGGVKDQKTAVVLYRLAAAQKDPQAQVKLGSYYEEGIGNFPLDEKEAFKLYQLAAAQNNSNGHAKLGNFHEYGKGGLQQDKKEAVRLYQLSAKQNNAGGQYQLGLCYDQGKGGLQQDHKEAARLFQLAAAQNHPEAQARLGQYYENGMGGLPQDEKEAVRLYELAAGIDSEAQAHLGRCHEEGIGGLSVDEKKAAEFYQLSAQQGNPYGHYYLGMCYRDGTGLPPNAQKAIKHIKLAAEQDLPDAEHDLGVSYMMKKDYKESIQWFHKAAEQGVKESQYNLGLHYMYGLGVTKNVLEATKWLQAAKAQGNKQAGVELAKLISVKIENIMPALRSSPVHTQAQSQPDKTDKSNQANQLTISVL